MDDANYKPSRREFKIGHTIVGVCLVVCGVLISAFATGEPIVVNAVSIICIAYGIIKIAIAQSA